MLVRNTSEGGVSEKRKFGQGGGVRGNYREGGLDREILTGKLNPRTLHPLCQFSPPQGTHREGYLAKAE